MAPGFSFASWIAFNEQSSFCKLVTDLEAQLNDSLHFLTSQTDAGLLPEPIIFGKLTVFCWTC